LNAKTLFVYSISYFNLGGIGALFGGAKPTKDPRGDGTALISGQSSAGFRWWGAWGPGVVGGPMCGCKMFR